MSNGWIGVDLDGTLALHTDWMAWDEFGLPITEMVERVKKWIADGHEVRIFTARANMMGQTFFCQLKREVVTREMMINAIQDWTEKYIGVRLPVTHEKDYNMIELWDDRARQVEVNTGRLIGEPA
jgi:hypothetical protein